MMSFVRRTGGVMLLAVTLGLALVVIGPAPARAVEVNQPAPDFRLPSPTGGETPSGTSGARSGSSSSSTAPTSLPPERGTFRPGMADYKRFEALGIQILGANANLTSPQQTFAQTLKLPFPLLSDFPDRKVIPSYGVLNERSMTAHRSFFLIDPQRIVRKKWVVPDGATTIVPSDPLLREIEETVVKP